MKNEDKKKIKICDFCGSKEGEGGVKRIIVGLKACICNQCIELCNDIIYEMNKKNNDDDKEE